MGAANAGFEPRNRPDWLCDSLPYAYMAIGCVTIAGFELADVLSMFSATLPKVLGLRSVLGTLSGIVLIAAGIMVIAMRVTNRRKLATIREEIAASEQRKRERQ